MIFTERTVTVTNDNATINKPLILYRGDKNIELKITIAESQFKFRNTDASNVIETTDASYAQLVINTPYGSPIFSDVAATKNGAVIFVITEGMIDEIRELGSYSIQIRLLDDNKQSRATIPPVSNAIEIKAPIAIEDGSAIDGNAVNTAMAGYAVTTTSAPLEAFDSQGNYIKTTWGEGDVISDAKLNKIEAGIDGVNKKVANNSSQIKEIAKKTIVEGNKIYLAKNDGTKLDEGTVLPCSSGGTGLTARALTSSELAELLNTPIKPSEPTKVEVTSITASSNYLALNVGETRKITYTIQPSNATDKTVTFASSDSSKVSVDQQGNIEALAEGDILITITASNGVSTDCQVVVTAVSQVVSVTGITLNVNNGNVQPNETLKLTATVLPSNATNKSVTWESNNTGVATVNNGTVTGVADGEATITCKSVENPSITATCQITVQTVEALTSITNGLVHSYNLAGLSGDSTAIEDLTGNINMTMTDFSNVATAKTELGIKADSTNARLVLNSISPTATNKYTVVVKIKGEYKNDQGIFGVMGNVKLCGHIGNGVYQYTTAAYLDTNVGYITRGNNKWDVIVATFDLDNKQINTYINGLKHTTTYTDSLSWNNTLKVFDGYITSNNVGLVAGAVLTYNRCVTDEEAIIICNELVNGNPYIGVNVNNSKLTEANRVNLLNEFTLDGLQGTTINSVVSNNTITNIISTNSNGFIGDDNTSINDFDRGIEGTIITAFYVDDINTEQYLYKNPTNPGAVYFKIINGKLSGRYTSSWILDSKEFSDVVITQGVNILAFMFNIQTDEKIFYINGTKYNVTRNIAAPIIIDEVLCHINNPTLPISAILQYSKKLDETSIQSISNELKGGN